jgi:hypothetical protein
MSVLLVILGAGALFGGLMLFWRHLGASMFLPPMAYARDAVRYLWVEVYGQDAGKQPRVFWVEVTDKNRCSPGCYRGATGCVGGEALLDAKTVNVAWEPSHHQWLADTALAHELAHFVTGPSHNDAHIQLTTVGITRLRTWEAARK